MNSIYMHAVNRKKAQDTYNRQYLDATPLDVTFVQSGFILPYKSMGGGWESRLGGVIDADLNYVSSSRMSFGPVFGGSYPIDMHHCTDIADKTILFCGMLSPIWGHYLFDSLSRLWYAMQHPGAYVLAWLYDTASESALFTQHGVLKGNYGRIFDLLQIDQANLLFISEQDRPVKAKEIIVPKSCFISGQYYSNEFTSFYTKLRDSVPTSQDKKNEKIFMSRKKWQHQRESGMNNIEDVFVQNDFTPLIPEDISLEKMISALKRASILVSPEGSAAHNSIFCMPDTEVIILQRSKNFNLYQPIIDQSIKAKTTFIDTYPALDFLALPGGPFITYNNANALRFYLDKKMNLHRLKKFNFLNLTKTIKIILMLKLRGSNGFAARCVTRCVDVCKKTTYCIANIVQRALNKKVKK